MIQPPIFILCGSRFGSTLTRYILDTHSEIFCPPELHLCSLAENLAWVYQNLIPPTPGLDEQARIRKVIEQVNIQIHSTLQPFLQREGKSVWCEKSILTIANFASINATFPGARYVCLYRNCLDQLASALETLAQDPSGKGYAFESFLSSAPDPINGLVDYWLHTCNAILSYQSQQPNKSFPLKYEDLVENPEYQARLMCEFLNLPFEQTMVDDAFRKQHTDGAGDHKIKSTSGIETSSVGRGKTLDLSQITEDRIERINILNEKLGYEQLLTPSEKSLSHKLQYSDYSKPGFVEAF